MIFIVYSSLFSLLSLINVVCAWRMSPR